MGLDMDVFRRASNGVAINPEDTYVDEELIYWRKANEIRQWFCDNTSLEYDDNCKEIPIDKNTLILLRDDCIAVIDAFKDIEKAKTDEEKEKLTSLALEIAESTMPTQGGFFFGSTDYDEYYLDDLKYTVDEINKVLPRLNDSDDLYYYDWW